MKKLLCLTLIIVAACAPASTPTPAPTPTTAPFALSAENYLLIEYARVVDGTGRLTGLAVDFPHYSFDAAAGELKLAAFPAPPVRLGASQIGFFATAISRTGAAGSGAQSNLTPLDVLPFQTRVPVFSDFVNNAERYDDIALVIKSASADGAAQIELGTESRALKPGEKWERVAEKDVTTARGAGRLKITHTLTNYGLLDRAKIIQQTK